VEPLVMDSEITGLHNLRGFLKVGNLVVRLAIPYIKPSRRAEDFVPRPQPARVAAEPAPPPLAEALTNPPEQRLAPPGPFFQ
jgi:hypothetical protein